MKITSMQKMIAVSVGLLALAALAVVLLVLPMFGELSSLQLQKEGAQRQYDLAKAELARLESTKARSAATEAEFLKIGTQMPDSPQLPTLIMELQDIANASGVSVTSFTPGQPNPVAGGKYTEISLNTQVKAKWADLLDYLHRLDKATRVLRVTNLTISPVASTETTVTTNEEIELTVSLTTKAYVIGANGVVSGTQ